MNQSNTTRLTVARVCHEIANHLNAIKFLCDDESELRSEDLKELFNDLNLLSYTMSFFRGIYSGGSAVDTLDAVLGVAKLKNISISDKNNVLTEFVVSNSKTSILGILYLIIKVCKSQDVIVISYRTSEPIKISVDKQRVFPEAIYLAFNDNLLQENVFNVFALYVKDLAKEQGFEISAELVENDGLRVNIYGNAKTSIKNPFII
ncbi:MAG: hypothetical protein LBM19_02145 [Holosporales bacterium]|nr:hypothetical protein [Holosporales bacterium]